MIRVEVSSISYVNSTSNYWEFLYSSDIQINLPDQVLVSRHPVSDLADQTLHLLTPDQETAFLPQ